MLGPCKARATEGEIMGAEQTTTSQREPAFLMVSDEDELRRFIRTTLASMGHHEVGGSVNDMETVLGALTRDKPNIIIVDIDRYGLEIVRRIRQTRLEHGQPDPVIYIMHTNPYRTRWAEQLRIVGFLQKPVDGALLRSKIEEMVAQLQHPA